VAEAKFLIWSVEETAGFDAAIATIDGRRLHAEGRAAGRAATPYWLEYRLETEDDFTTRRLSVTARTAEDVRHLDLQRTDGRWTVNGQARPDLGDALDCDLGACPLTNTMPILRFRLHERAGDVSFVMAFVEVPTLRVVLSRQRYTYLRPRRDGGAVVRYRSGSFQSDLEIDNLGFVLVYPHLGRRVEAPPLDTGTTRAAGPGSARPE
jgi:hypothetical protein